MFKVYIPATAVLSVSTQHPCNVGLNQDIQKQFSFETVAQDYTIAVA